MTTARDRVEILGPGGEVRAVLFCGDCLALAEAPASGAEILRADAIISDPPYGIAYRHSGRGRGVHAFDRACGPTLRRRLADGRTSSRNTDAIPGDGAPFDPGPWCDAGAAPGGPRVLLWGADHFHARLPPGGTFLAWDKAPPRADGSRRGPRDNFIDAEFAWCNWREPRNVFRMLWKGVAAEKLGEDNARRWHPTQKPVRLMAWCIERAGPRAGQTVLDPYMGAGATGVAAMAAGVRFIGVEIERKWFDVACRRIGEAAAQGLIPMEAAE